MVTCTQVVWSHYDHANENYILNNVHDGNPGKSEKIWCDSAQINAQWNDHLSWSTIATLWQLYWISEILNFGWNNATAQMHGNWIYIAERWLLGAMGFLVVRLISSFGDTGNSPWTSAIWIDIWKWKPSDYCFLLAMVSASVSFGLSNVCGPRKLLRPVHTLDLQGTVLDNNQLLRKYRYFGNH